MFCKNCGSELSDSAKFCTKCGTKVESTPTPVVEEPKAKEKVKEKVVYKEKVLDIPPEYKPISMWGYFGYELLFSIPLIGFILLIVFALGGHSNKNVRNFAASYFCLFIIGVVIFIALISAGALGYLTFSALGN